MAASPPLPLIPWQETFRPRSERSAAGLLPSEQHPVWAPSVRFCPLAVPQAKSESSSLGGGWSGGGTVVYSSGQRERARCHAQYSGGGGSQVSVSATCATPSGSVSQSARLRRTGPNSYARSFFNPQYNVAGRIRVTTHGNSQSVGISTGGGSASLTLGPEAG